MSQVVYVLPSVQGRVIDTGLCSLGTVVASSSLALPKSGTALAEEGRYLFRSQFDAEAVIPSATVLVLTLHPVNLVLLGRSATRAEGTRLTLPPDLVCLSLRHDDDDEEEERAMTKGR